MKYETFRKVRILTTSFVTATIGISIVKNNMFLALFGVLVGIVFLSFVKKFSRDALVDERIQSIGNKAARLAYVVVTLTTGMLSLLFILSGERTGEVYVEALGVVLSYVTMMSVAVYSVAYKYYVKQYGDKE